MILFIAAVFLLTIIILSKRKTPYKANSPTITAERQTYKVIVRLSKNGEITPIDLGIYSNPSGGFTNWATYKVTGINSTTKRKNTRKYATVNERSALKLAYEEGLSEASIIEIFPHEPPTENHLNYAKELGLSIPDGACDEDVYAMILRVIHSKKIVKEEHFDDKIIEYRKPQVSPTTEFAQFACEKGIHFSSYTGESQLLYKTVYHLNERDKFAFYAYCVICNKKHERIGNLNFTPYFEKLYEFADNCIDSQALIRSLNGREPKDYKTPHKGTVIYKETIQFLKTNELC